MHSKQGVMCLAGTVANVADLGRYNPKVPS